MPCRVSVGRLGGWRWEGRNFSGHPTYWSEVCRCRFGQEGPGRSDEQKLTRGEQSASKRLIQLALLLAGAAIAVVAMVQLRGKRETAEVTAQSIQDQLDALDPVTRGAVIARLTKDAAKDVQALRGRR